MALALERNLIETTPRPTFAGRDQRVLPAAGQAARALEAIECLVERAVRGESPRMGSIAHLLCQQEAVSLRYPPLAKLQRGFENRDFQGHE
jgi:hypothetical protein